MNTKELDTKVVNDALNLLYQKSQDYNSSIQREDYFPFGIISYHQMLHIKVLRIQSLIQNNAKPNFESIKDSLQDLLNYTIMALSHLEAQENDSRRTRDTTS